MRRPFALVCLVLACLMLAAPGCGKRKVTIKGKFIKKNGEVQTYGESEYVTLQFIPADPDDARRTYTAKIDHAAGTYEVELIAGQYRVSFYAPPPIDPRSPRTSVVSGPPLVGKPNASALDSTVYDFRSSTSHDIAVP